MPLVMDEGLGPACGECGAGTTKMFSNVYSEWVWWCFECHDYFEKVAQ